MWRSCGRICGGWRIACYSEIRPLLDSEAPPPLSRKHGFFRKHAAKLIASAVITAALLYTLKKAGLQLWPGPEAFAHVKWWTVPAYVAIFVAVSYFRATRWRFLLRSFADVPMKKVITASWVGFAAILLFPFRMGEVVRPYMIREKGKVSLTRATGSVVGERVVDGLYLTVVLAIALVLVPTRNAKDWKIPGLPNVTVGYVRDASFLMLGFFAAVFACIALFYFARGFAEKLTQKTLGLVSKKLADKVADTAIKLGEGLHFLGRPRDAIPFLAETTAYWGLNALGMWLLAWGCGVTHADGTSLSFLEACALMGTLGVTILIPGPPFLLGTFQAGIIAGLGMYCSKEVLEGPGIAYASLMFALQFAWTALAGAGSLVAGGNKAAALSALEDEPAPPSIATASE
jgi:hypothetical protein